jgi:hypothetical protein
MARPKLNDLDRPHLLTLALKLVTDAGYISDDLKLIASRIKDDGLRSDVMNIARRTSNLSYWWKEIPEQKELL